MLHLLDKSLLHELRSLRVQPQPNFFAFQRIFQNFQMFFCWIGSNILVTMNNDNTGITRTSQLLSCNSLQN